MKKWIGGVFVLAMLAGAGAVWRWPKPVEAALVFPTQLLEFGPMTETVSATGTIVPRDVVCIGAETAGRVVRVHFDTQQLVKVGDPLVSLDDRLAKLKCKQALAAAELAQSEAVRAEAMRDAARSAWLRMKEAVSQVSLTRDIDQAEAQMRAAEAGLKSALARIKEAQAAQQLADLGLELTIVRSPINGTIIDKQVTAGQQIAPPMSGQLMTIAPDLEQLNVIAQVSETDIGAVRVGRPATFTVNAWPDHVFDGVVKQVAMTPITQQSAVFFAVTIAVVNRRQANSRDWMLRPGMPAAVDVVLRKHDTVWKLPIAAATVELPDSQLSDKARKKNARWTARPDHADWQRLWVLHQQRGPWPVFVRTGGKSATGESGIHDSQFIEILGWDPEEPAPAVEAPPKVIIAAPNDGKAESKGLKLF